MSDDRPYAGIPTQRLCELRDEYHRLIHSGSAWPWVVGLGGPILAFGLAIYAWDLHNGLLFVIATACGVGSIFFGVRHDRDVRHYQQKLEKITAELDARAGE